MSHLRVDGHSVSRQRSVYEKLLEISDIMSDDFELCVGHFHIIPEVFLSIIGTMGSMVKNSTGTIFARVWDISYIFGTPRTESKILDCLAKPVRPENVSDYLSDVFN